MLLVAMSWPMRGQKVWGVGRCSVPLGVFKRRLVATAVSFMSRAVPEATHSPSQLPGAACRTRCKSPCHRKAGARSRPGGWVGWARGGKQREGGIRKGARGSEKRERVLHRFRSAQTPCVKLYHSTSIIGRNVPLYLHQLTQWDKARMQRSEKKKSTQTQTQTKRDSAVFIGL
jgi:hypothetical protein